MMGSIILYIKEAQGNSKRKVCKLMPGESIVINRDNWRSTMSGNQGAVFLECIEGKYDQNLREEMENQSCN